MLYLCLTEPPTDSEAWRKATRVEAENERLASLGFILSSRRRRREAIAAPNGVDVWIRRAAWSNALWSRRTVRVTSTLGPPLQKPIPTPEQREGAA